MITVNKNDDLNKALSDAEAFLQELEVRRGGRKGIPRKKPIKRKSVNGKINCCPKCGNKIVVSELCQYTRDHIIGDRGKMLRKYTSNDNGYIDVSIASCTNPSCDVRWEDGEFTFDDDDYFIDLKYTDRRK